MKATKILVFGLPGSGKTTLANKLAQKLAGEHLNADALRERFQDWDFSDTGRARQVKRMQKLSDEARSQFVIMDFVCPKFRFRQMLAADIVIFMDTLEKSRYADTNAVFEAPALDEKIDYHITDYQSDHHVQRIASQLLSFDWRKPTVQMLGRWQPFHDGHLALFQRAIKKTGQVVIQVRDCQNWNESNPFDFEKVQDGIIGKLSDYGYQQGRDYIVQLVPNIVNITYGRDVGYQIEQESFDEAITSISATKIRQSMGYEK